jgi:hypothetical protein
VNAVCGKFENNAILALQGAMVELTILNTFAFFIKGSD